MYTKDFIKKVEALPFVGEVNIIGHLIKIRNHNADLLAVTVVNKEYSANTVLTHFEHLPIEYKMVLMRGIMQYISTPVEEREPENKFRLRAKDFLGIEPDEEFLNYVGFGEKLFMGGKEQVPSFTTIFTDSELKELFTPEQLEWIEMTFDKEWIDE